MITKHIVSIKDISWIKSYDNTLSEGIENYYEPESTDELVELCREFYKEKIEFILVGHTSNTYFNSEHKIFNLISTRRCKHFLEEKERIICDCGCPVSLLSRKMVQEGIEGFEGLIDLPGTVGSAIYGNSGCYNCSVSKLLLKADVLLSDGQIVEVDPEWFAFRERSSTLKRGENKGVIVRVILKKNQGNVEKIKAIASNIHQNRKSSQPQSSNSLGSIFVYEGKGLTFLGRFIFGISGIYGRILKLIGISHDKRKRMILSFQLYMLFCVDLKPYLKTWNWWQWSDKKSHALFWKYVRIHNLLSKNNNFEIEFR